MKALKPLVLTVLALASASLAATAAAAIVSTLGDAREIAPPPSVELGALQSDRAMFAFDEKQCVLLTRPLLVNITEPGKYDDEKDLSRGRIPAGTLVSSHFVHADSETGRKGHPVFFNGGIVTDADVLGIAILQHALNDSDVLGAPETDYPKKTRQLNLFVNDWVDLKPDRRTVRIHLGNHTHSDQVRVITECAAVTAR